MQSFRTEIENPVVERDIIELEKKIRLFRKGNLDEEKFKSLRLARGVYGQRQEGVQMVRIKIPHGRLTARQLLRISDVSDEYSNGNLHTTTRQDIQIHFVSLDRTPELWAELEKDRITMREACGNTVRNVTASSIAGIDPDEPFDVTPYAQAFTEYFLRNPICQELGRKFKVSFSSSESDTAYAFMHDIGFIAREKTINGKVERGFKVLIGGGLGATPALAQLVTEFMPEDEIIPFAESLLRIFDRHGERAKRNKARMKYLIKAIGLEELLRLAGEERNSLKNKKFKVDTSKVPEVSIPETREIPEYTIKDEERYRTWLKTNVFKQKQKDFYAVTIRLLTGDISTEKARKLAALVKEYAADDIRITVNQGLLLKFVKGEYLGYLYSRLDDLGLAKPGFDSTHDITTCPGTDTCNLGISSSMGVTRELEKVIAQEYPDLIHNSDIKIKISGCMNSCGQHSIANIGMHGSTMKAGKAVAPAMLFLLGGGVKGNGEGSMAEKLTKIPSKKSPDALRRILDDYLTHAYDGEYFNDYYQRQGRTYFYNLIKDLTDPNALKPSDFIDWGHNEKFSTAIGIGECAGVTIDLVATLLVETEEKLEKAKETLEQGSYADSIYHSYTAFVNAAKAILVSDEAQANTQAGIIQDFDENYVSTGKMPVPGGFEALVYRMRENGPTSGFAEEYLKEAKQFYKKAVEYRERTLEYETQN